MRSTLTRRARSRRLGHRRRRDGQREREAAAEILALALGAHEAAVQLDEAAHDGQPQSRAAVAAAQCRLDLVEGIPDSRKLLARDADAGVEHRDPHLVLVASRGDRDAAALRVNFTAFESRLTSTCCMRSGSAWTAGVPGSISLTTAMCLAWAATATTAIPWSAIIRAIGRLGRELDAPGLEPGDVEQLVDEVREPLRAPEDGFLLLDLLGRQRAVHLAQEQPAVPDDRGQRGPELVADHGEELRLELVEPSQLLVDLCERACLPAFSANSCSYSRTMVALSMKIPYRRRKARNATAEQRTSQSTAR
jgi:hypothetical protein